LYLQEEAERKASQQADEQRVHNQKEAVVEDVRFKQKCSTVWEHFDHPKLYNGQKKSKCKICEKLISAVNTTNLRSHMNSQHKDIVKKALEESETVSCHPELQTCIIFISVRVMTCLVLWQVPVGVGNLGLPEGLKLGQGTLTKMDADRKIMLDRLYTKSLCKGARPLSMGEDKYLKEWVLQITHGR
jgi:hypothetical protein